VPTGAGRVPTPGLKATAWQVGAPSVQFSPVILSNFTPVLTCGGRYAGPDRRADRDPAAAGPHRVEIVAKVRPNRLYEGALEKHAPFSVPELSRAVRGAMC